MRGFIAGVEREDLFQACQTNPPAPLDELRPAAATRCQIGCGWLDRGTTGQCLCILTAPKDPTDSRFAESLTSILVANRVSSGDAIG